MINFSPRNQNVWYRDQYFIRPKPRARQLPWDRDRDRVQKSCLETLTSVHLINDQQFLILHWDTGRRTTQTRIPTSHSTASTQVATHRCHYKSLVSTFSAGLWIPLASSPCSLATLSLIGPLLFLVAPLPVLPTVGVDCSVVWRSWPRRRLQTYICQLSRPHTTLNSLHEAQTANSSQAISWLL